MIEKPPSKKVRVSKRLEEGVLALIRADGWSALRSIILMHPALLAPEADKAMLGIRGRCLQEGQAELAAVLNQRWDFLIRCREVGIERAYLTCSLDLGDGAPLELRRRLQKLASYGTDPIHAPRRAEACRRALELVDRVIYPYLWGLLNHDLGALITACLGPDRNQLCDEALQAYQRALEARSPDDAPVERVDTLCGIAAVHLARRDGTRAENLEHAIAAYQEALAALPKDRFPVRWGRLCRLTADIYVERECGRRAQNIERAVGLLEGALQVHDQETCPQDWGRDQISLGFAYLARPDRNRPENLAAAERAAVGALEVFDDDKEPIEHARALRIAIEVYAYAEQDTELEEDEDPEGDSVDVLQQAAELLKAAGANTAWLAALSQLAGLYVDRTRGYAPDNREEAIRLYEQVQKQYRAQGVLHEVARCSYGLARSYEARLLDGTAKNLENAIGHASAALSGFKQQGMRLDAARTQCLLAMLHQKTESADEPAVQEEVIRLFKESLQALTYEDEPATWLDAMLYQAAAWADRSSGDAAENRVQRIRLLEEVVATCKAERWPVYWAAAASDLAAEQFTQAQDDKSIDTDRIISLLAEVARVRPREDDPESWAKDQIVLARALLHPSRGPGQDFKRAASVCQRALAILSIDQFPNERAEALHVLADAYILRPDGSRRKSVDGAISALQEAARIYRKLDAKGALAHTLGRLGHAYLTIETGDRAENVEEAIRLYQEAQRIRDAMAPDPIQRAYTSINLADAYEARLQGDKEENIRRAVLLLEEAIAAFQEHGLAQQAAESTVALARIWSQYPLQRGTDNQEDAIRLLEQSLAALSPKDAPDEWAHAAATLARFLHEDVTLTGHANQERAFRLFEEVLRIWTRDKEPRKWASVKRELGRLYLIHPIGDRSENIERSIVLLGEALDVFTRASTPREWAWTIRALGSSFLQRKVGERTENLRIAIYRWRQSLECFEEDLDARVYAEISLQLGIAFTELQDVEQAALWLERAVAAVGRDYEQESLLIGRQAAAQEAGDIYREAAGALVQAGCIRQAVVALESSRARWLAEAMVRDLAELGHIARTDVDAYVRYQRAALWLRQLESRELDILINVRWSQADTSLAQLRSQKERAREELVDALKRIRALSAASDPLGACWSNPPNPIDISPPL